jgi:hypothetical protein
MPEITGFRALTYDPSRMDLSQVVTPWWLPISSDRIVMGHAALR